MGRYFYSAAVLAAVTLFGFFFFAQWRGSRLADELADFSTPNPNCVRLLNEPAIPQDMDDEEAGKFSAVPADDNVPAQTRLPAAVGMIGPENPSEAALNRGPIATERLFMT